MDLAGRQIGNYIAKSVLGSGGMGVVYLCEHPLIRRRVAAKVLHEELAASEEIVRRLFAEARAANDINSEHIIEVLDFGRMVEDKSELVYLIMEFLEGEGLGQRLWRTGLTIEESLHIVAQSCEALQASHTAGIVHRDLKPENIFLLERRGDPNFVKILDFGIAKVSGSPSTKTRTGVLLGTPCYMSPEQCRGAGAVDARADVYSMGIVLYELVTGDVPFNGEGYGAVLLSQMTEKPRPPTQINKDLPRAIEAIVLRALEKNPDARYQTMAEMGHAVAEVQEFLQVRSPIPQIPRKGLHQRETLVSTGKHKAYDPAAGPAGSAVGPAATPVDISLAMRMQSVEGDARTQIMGVVSDDDLVPPAPPESIEPAATMLDRELPAEVLKYRAMTDAATQMRDAPVGQAVDAIAPTAAQGMPAARPVTTPPVSTATVMTAPSPNAATLIKERRAEPLPEHKRPTSELDQIPMNHSWARVIVVIALLLAGAGILGAWYWRSH